MATAQRAASKSFCIFEYSSSDNKAVTMRVKVGVSINSIVSLLSTNGKKRKHLSNTSDFLSLSLHFYLVFRKNPISHAEKESAEQKKC